MADDGMLLNFSVGDGLITTGPIFKGGRWRDRVKAKKTAAHFHKKIGKPTPSPGTGPNATGITDRSETEALSAGRESRPVKRQRVEEDFIPSHGNGPPRKAQNTSSSGRPLGPDGKPRQIISSLFSFNPISKPTGAEEAEQVDAQPSNAPLIDGLSNFTTLGLKPSLATHLLTKMELKAPTAIQKVAIPQLIKEDSDAFLQAETGSGKTLAYLLPIVQRIITMTGQDGAAQDGKVHRDSGLFAIILAPTRELSRQITTVLERLLRCANWIVCGTVIGGEKKKSEKARLRKGLNILVATPGRLADHLENTEVLDVSEVRWLVLDEGDRLMELGFEEEIKGIMEKLEARSRIGRSRRAVEGLPKRRITMLCSATMKMNVQRLGEISLKDAIHVKADPSDTDDDGLNQAGDAANFSAPAQLKQSYSVVPAKLRLVALTAVLKRAFVRKGSVMKVIVFFDCADSVDFHFDVFTRPEKVEGEDASEPKTPAAIVKELEDKETKSEEDARKKEEATVNTSKPATAFSTPEVPVTLHRLHGSLAQNVRTATLAAFTKSDTPAILICTDVAARGLDLPNIDFVIEYDPPFSKDDHLHRIGRTARAGRDGRTMIFLLPGEEENYVEILKRGYREGGVASGPNRSDSNDLLKKGFGSPGLGAGKDWEERATEWQLNVERWVLENEKALEMARRAFQSHIRAYATHVAAERQYFNIKGLHLGHLAKAFALRDRPGNINIPGMRPGKDTGKGEKSRRIISAKKAASQDRGEKKTGQEKPNSSTDPDAAKKMRKKMNEHMNAASEFNFG
jgi:ATP-dependent RNA helicase DDX31/DBP7